MKLRFLSKSLFCLIFAAVSAAAWNLHVLCAHHGAMEDCQVCSVVAAPELNSDCGTNLISQPLNFNLLSPAAPLLAAFTVSIPAFYGRAPPAA